MKKCLSKTIDKCERGLLWALPVVVFFSYYPVLKLGDDGRMNFELSIPLIWLAVFGLLSLLRLGPIVKTLGLKKCVLLAIFPLFASLSVIWSENRLRGLLVAGVLDLVFLAGLNIISMKLPRKTWHKLAKIHIIAGIFAALFCLLQCVLDLAGVGHNYTLLCEGCGFEVLGFPHPNGLAIEPQFMGNLLIAPALLSLYFAYNNIVLRNSKRICWHGAALSFLLIMSLYICFSRGAIYSFILGMIFLALCTGVWKKHLLMRFVVYFGISGLAFAGGLFLQGVMSEFSTTSEGFAQGAARAVHQLSLGKIDLREKENTEPTDAKFDGYIEESTDIRIDFNELALDTWKRDAKTVFLGVGLGGAGKSISDNFSGYEKLIIQNQYLSLLLETGCVGLACLVISGGALLIEARLKRAAVVFRACILAYAISINFFSGLPNALHIYLVSPMLMRLGALAKYDKLK